MEKPVFELLEAVFI